MQNLERIDDYFQNRLLSAERASFEQQLTADPDFAGEVAFYLCTVQAVREQAVAGRKKRFRELYDQSKTGANPVVLNQAPVRKLRAWMAAAAVVAMLLIGYFIFSRPDSPRQLAEQYVQRHLNLLGVEMSSEQDSLQTALDLYNSGKWAEALRRFEEISRTNPEQVDAAIYAGLASLRLEDYDKAFGYFLRIESYPGLHSNPGKFYRALTFMRRDGPGDKDEAGKLLRQVVEQDLEGKGPAQRWLEKW